jgi:hypothetical protein
VKSIAALVFGAVLVLGPGKWEAPTPGHFEAWLPGGRDVSAMTVQLTDATELVLAMSPGGRGGPDGVANVPGTSDKLTVTTVSGFCDDYLQLTFRRAQPGYELIATTASSPANGGSHCSFLMGISRTVTLTVSTPIDATDVQYEAR